MGPTVQVVGFLLIISLGATQGDFANVINQLYQKVAGDNGAGLPQLRSGHQQDDRHDWQWYERSRNHVLNQDKQRGQHRNYKRQDKNQLDSREDNQKRRERHQKFRNLVALLNLKSHDHHQNSEEDVVIYPQQKFHNHHHHSHDSGHRSHKHSRIWDDRNQESQGDQIDNDQRERDNDRQIQHRQRHQRDYERRDRNRQRDQYDEQNQYDQRASYNHRQRTDQQNRWQQRDRLDQNRPHNRHQQRDWYDSADVSEQQKYKSISRQNEKQQKALRTPIIKSLLRISNDVNCGAKDQCVMTCTKKREKKIPVCQNACEQKYECEEEKEEDDCQLGGTCEESGDENPSTRGILIQEENKCKTC